MWRGRLEACCFVGSIRFDITPGPAGNIFACNMSQYKRKDLGISEMRISSALNRNFLLCAYVL